MRTKEIAFSAEHRARLAPILKQLDDAKQSTFLDLYELLLMFAETIPHSMLKWEHPRVLVHIKKRRAPKLDNDSETPRERARRKVKQRVDAILLANRERAARRSSPSQPGAGSREPGAARPSEAEPPTSPPPRPKRARTGTRGGRSAGDSSSASASDRRSSRD